MYYGAMRRNQRLIIDIGGVGWSQSMGCSILKILTNFDLCPFLTSWARINFQSLNGHMMGIRLGYIFPMNTAPYQYVWIG